MRMIKIEHSDNQQMSGLAEDLLFEARCMCSDDMIADLLIS